MTLPTTTDPAHGGGRLVIESRQSGHRSVQVMEFSDRGHVRMTHEDDDSFGLLLQSDGTPHFFGTLSGRAIAVDLIAGLRRTGGSSLSPGNGADAVAPAQVTALDPMGQPHVIAGIEGEGFRVEWCDFDCGRRFEEIVLTRDSRLTLCVRTLAAALRHDTGIRSHDTRLDRMVERGFFALAGEGYRVISARFDPPPPERFELNAAPGDDLRLMFRAVIEAARNRVLSHAPSAAAGNPADRPSH